jgi:hypothetical protein
VVKSVKQEIKERKKKKRSEKRGSVAWTEKWLNYIRLEDSIFGYHAALIVRVDVFFFFISYGTEELTALNVQCQER